MDKYTLRAICASGLIGISACAHAGAYDGKKVLYIDSYHAGYDWSDGITAAVQQSFADTGVELRVLRMDTKRNNSDDFKQKAALEAKSAIEQFKPDVVIASDDNASKYLIAPFYKEAELPFVFCGVNWDATVYGFPFDNVTGMVEVSATDELVELAKQFAKGDRVGFLGEDTLTDRKEAGYYEKMLEQDIDDVYVKTFEEWKEAFLALQDRVDILVHYNYASLEGWSSDEAAVFVGANAKVPTVAVQEGQMQHSMLGYLKVPEEQGNWAAQTALKILNGTSPSEIPVSRNKQGKVVLNLRLAEALGVQVPYEIIETAYMVIE